MNVYTHIVYVYVCQRTIDNSLYFFFSTFLFFGSYKFVSSVTSYIDLRQKTFQPLNQSEPNGLQSDIFLLWDIFLRIYMHAVSHKYVYDNTSMTERPYVYPNNWYKLLRRITCEKYIVWGVVESELTVQIASSVKQNALIEANKEITFGETDNNIIYCMWIRVRVRMCTVLSTKYS